MSNRRFASSAKIVTAPGSILSTSSRSTTRPPSSSALQRSRNASCSITTTRSSKPEPGRRHPPQAAAERLLGKDLRLRVSERRVTITQTLRTSQPSRSISTLTMQRISAVGPVDLARGPAGEVEVGLGDLARAVRVDDQQPIAGELGQLAQVVARLVSRLRVLAHDEEHGALARRARAPRRTSATARRRRRAIGGRAGRPSRRARPSRRSPRR